MKEAIKLMLHEMEYVLDCINNHVVPFDGDDFHEALRLGRRAIAQADNQYPVAWMEPDWADGTIFRDSEVNKTTDFFHDHMIPLYTTPQQRKPLTDEQIDKAMAENKQTLIDAADNYWKMRRAYARIIEAAHGIKE